jgi:hypothetical protein
MLLRYEYIALFLPSGRIHRNHRLHRLVPYRVILEPFTMATSIFARTIARRAVGPVIRLNTFASVGPVRFASYFTPGTFSRFLANDVAV